PLLGRAAVDDLDPDDAVAAAATVGDADLVAVAVGDGVEAGGPRAAVADVHRAIDVDVVRPDEVVAAREAATAAGQGRDQPAGHPGGRRRRRPERPVDVAGGGQQMAGNGNGGVGDQTYGTR